MLQEQLDNYIEKVNLYPYLSPNTKMYGAWVQSLVGQLRSHMPRGVAKKYIYLKTKEKH